MKILIVCQYFHPEPFRITDIAIELQKAGHTVSVLTGIPNYPTGRFYEGYGVSQKKVENYNGLSIMRVPILPRKNGSKLNLLINYLSFALSASIYALRIKPYAYDIIFVYQLSPVIMSIPGIVASRSARVPMVLYVADLWPESLSATDAIRSKAIVGLVGWIVDRIYCYSKHIFVTSSGFIERIVSRGQPLEKIQYIPQYPEDVYRPVAISPNDPAHEEIPDGFTITFTGNVGVAQGLDVVVDAAEILSDHEDINWVILGNGRDLERLRERVKSKGLDERVLFLGARPMDRIPAYLALSDVALLCLSAKPLFALTLPAKLQSYFACGMPVIGSVDGDPARVILEAGAGIVGPAGDASALARNVLDLYKKTQGELKLFGFNAYKYYNTNFRKEKIIAEIETSLCGIASHYSHDEKWPTGDI